MKNLGTKITVASLASLMSLAMVGGIAGTVAWYQFNTRVTTTIIGTNVSNTGVLQISKDGAEWTRDLITEDLIGQRTNGALITPVTFGQLNEDGSLPAHAYKAPDASENAYIANVNELGSYAHVYQQADKEHDYIQYDVYLRTMAANNGGLEQVSLPVFLSDILLDNVGGEIAKGLRVHLAIAEDGANANKFVFLSKEGVNHLALSSVLDLDADGNADIKGGYEHNNDRDKVVVYGNDGEYQDAKSIADIKANRLNGEIDPWNVDNIDKIICHTQEANPVKVTVTLWFEGWDDVVDNMEIDSSEIIFRKANYVYADSVEGLFVLDNGDYVAAQGKAVEDTDYYELFYKELELEEFAAVPAGSFIENQGVYAETNDVVAQNGVKYYERIVKAADVHYAETVTGMYLYNDNTEEYEESLTADLKAVDGTDYFEKVTHDEAYAVVPFEDALHQPLPENTRSVEGLYTLDNGVYHKAHGLNQDGVTYYELATGGKATVPTWNGENTANVGFRFGLTFDVGKNAFKA